MKTIALEVQDEYVSDIINFFKILPKNMVNIRLLSDEDDGFFDEKELSSRVEDYANNTVEFVTKEEIFENL
jgi:hypothetical protein